MELPVDEQYRRERERFRLRLHCEDCALYHEEQDRCAHGYPTTDHRRPRDAEVERKVVFCKDFEPV